MIDSGQGDEADDTPGRLAPLLSRAAAPGSLEERVTGTLTSAGLLRGGLHSRSWRLPLMTGIAAAVLFFLAGLWAGGRDHQVNPAAPTRIAGVTPRFVLLLYGPPDEASTPSDVEEHRQWARQLVTQGHSVSGEKLSQNEISLPLDSAAVSRVERRSTLQGFFIITARDDAEALSIARSSPHFRHGGRIVIRPIEPT